MKRIDATRNDVALRMRTTHADLIREDGRLERHCEHGIGHTVGHAEGAEVMQRADWVHGCDGCCSRWGKEEVSE